MTRIEFISELSRKLNRLPKEELDNVLSYYDEVFLDAGVGNEAETAEKLGSIDDIVRQIYADNNIAPDGEPEYYVETPDNNSMANNTANKNNQGTSFAIKLLIILLTFPIWLPVIGAVASIVLSIVVTFFAIAFAFLVTGIACIIIGIIELFNAPVIGIMTLGVGLILIGLFGLVAYPLLKVVFRGFRALFNKIISACHNFIEKRRNS